MEVLEIVHLPVKIIDVYFQKLMILKIVIIKNKLVDVDQFQMKTVYLQINRESKEK